MVGDKNNNKTRQQQKQFHGFNGFLSLQLGLSFELGLGLRLTNIFHFKYWKTVLFMNSLLVNPSKTVSNCFNFQVRVGLLHGMLLRSTKLNMVCIQQSHIPRPRTKVVDIIPLPLWLGESQIQTNNLALVCLPKPIPAPKCGLDRGLSGIQSNKQTESTFVQISCFQELLQFKTQHYECTRSIEIKN